ncbi:MULTISPECIES: DUF885 family protein [unclassified Massilia]|uniref:DUF885 domain-containing protein n=1 Tax=unclassified Massilia TaxID=2609279 RepID=UPI001781DFC5|nr:MULTISPECIES: DUF885 domain-containing protein [unclassified Massilia]MBD8530053.1 DUF885 domain-containing protein [Massilia sp. CFBP 13647]MBD8674118.1 DUF885 domain-containing protein [Massilia sp. CFBP 13721]
MPISSQRSLRAAVATLFVPLALGATVLPTAALAAPVAKTAAVKPNAAFDAWADRFADDWVRMNPQLASSTQYFSGAEQAALDRQLTPQTPARREQMVALAKTGVARLDKFLAGPLDDTQKISAAVMRWSLANVIANAPFEDFNFVFSQFGGPQVGLVNYMTQTHPMRSAQDVDSWLARLEQVGTRMDEALARARSASERKLIPPRFILERAQFQVDTFLKPAAPQNVLVTSLEKRSLDAKDLSPEARTAAIARATRIVEDKIRPAYQRVQGFMAELHPKTNDTAGISRLPDGRKAYDRAIANFTSTTLTADEIHAIGLREVARLEAEMDKHLRALGFTEGNIETRMKALDATFQPKGDEDPRPAILAKYKEMVKDAQARSESLFNLKPRAPVDVLREPPLTEASAAAHYSLPAPDGSRPGVFWVPMRGPKFDMIRMRSLSYHEAVPGHHFQLAIQQELAGIPKYRSARIFSGGSAHSEGWALYTERLAVEQGWYGDEKRGDVPGLLGALGSELFRARRLVVDTGLHTKGWTRQQAVDYGINVEEVDRYVVWPGQATAYMIGMLRIVELREKAKAELGPKFSLPAFHDMVLGAGSVPLDVLGQLVDGWIAKEKAKA